MPWNATTNVKQLVSIKNFYIKEIEIKTKKSFNLKI